MGYWRCLSYALGSEHDPSGVTKLEVMGINPVRSAHKMGQSPLPSRTLERLMRVRFPSEPLAHTLPCPATEYYPLYRAASLPYHARSYL
jgi:hypothetical protein